MPAVDDHRGATAGDAGAPDAPERGRPRASWTRVVLTLVALGALVFMGRRLGALLPGFAAWVLNWLYIPAIAAALLCFLLFPDGRLPSLRWRV